MESFRYSKFLMHILFLPSWYKTPENPITGSFFEEQAQALIRNGHKVGILFADIEMRFSSRWKRTKKQPPDFEDNGIPVFYCFTKSIIPRWRKINYWYVAYRARKKFQEYVNTYGKPDIIHAHSVFHGGIVAKELSEKSGIPFILTEHYTGLIISGMKDIAECYRQVRLVFDRSARNIAVSSDFRKRLIEMYNLDDNKVSVVHNLINPLFLKVKAAPVRKPFIFVVNAFLSEKKNHSLLFRAFKTVSATNSCLLKVIGDGKLRYELEKLAIELDLDKQIIFYGNVGRSEVKQILDKSHALVSSSKFETFGINIIEALASGRPVVATDSGGPKDIVEPFNGILVKKHTVDALATAMAKLIEDYDTYDSEIISQKCMERFSESAVSLQLSNVYKEVLNGKS